MLQWERKTLARVSRSHTVRLEASWRPLWPVPVLLAKAGTASNVLPARLVSALAAGPVPLLPLA